MRSRVGHVSSRLSIKRESRVRRAAGWVSSEVHEDESVVRPVRPHHLQQRLVRLGAESALPEGVKEAVTLAKHPAQGLAHSRPLAGFNMFLRS